MSTKTLWILALALGYTACSGVPLPTDDTKPGDDDDDDNVGDDDDDDNGPDSGTTTDSGGGPGPGDPYFRVAHTLLGGNFAYNTAQGVVNAATEYGEIEARISVYLGSEAWANDNFAIDSANVCEIQLYLADGPTPAWAVAPLFFGVDWDPKNGLATSCIPENGTELDPLAWGYPPNYIFDNPKYFPNWGIGVGPTVDKFSKDIVAGSIYEGFAGGGYIDNTWLPKGNGVEGYWSSGLEIDGDNMVRFDEDGAPILIDPEEWPVLGLPAPLPQALFFVTSSFIWSFKNPI